MGIPRFQRVILMVLDGLRPDAIDQFDLQSFAQLEEEGASTRTGSTVRPSVTAAAMGSLLTGVLPHSHGFTSDRFHVPRSRGNVAPLPATLRAAGYATSGFLAQTPFLYRRVAHVLARRLGVDYPHFIGTNADEIADAAAVRLATQRSGLIVFHLPDADRAGHAHGWMSGAYGDAARRLDRVLGHVRTRSAEVEHCDTLFMACADHGGGGTRSDDHDSEHPLDVTIPIAFAGPRVRAGQLLTSAGIVDIPATILAALRVPIPDGYVGRPMEEGFYREALAA